MTVLFRKYQFCISSEGTNLTCRDLLCLKLSQNKGTYNWQQAKKPQWPPKHLRIFGGFKKRNGRSFKKRTSCLK